MSAGEFELERSQRSTLRIQAHPPFPRDESA